MEGICVTKQEPPRSMKRAAELEDPKSHFAKGGIRNKRKARRHKMKEVKVKGKVEI